MFQQTLEQKQITDGKRLVFAGRRHVPSCALESGKDFARAAFAVPIEVGAESRRAALGDRTRDPPGMLIRRRELRLGLIQLHCLRESLNRSRKPRISCVKVGEIH